MARRSRWRDNVRVLRRWWRDRPGAVLSVARTPLRFSHIPSDLLEALKAEPEAIPYVLREMGERERRERLRVVGDPDAPLFRTPKREASWSARRRHLGPT